MSRSAQTRLTRVGSAADRERSHPRSPLRPGERVALVGATGAGKTTLAKLIAGMHTPTARQIRIGGIAVAALDPAAPQAAVVLVTQEVHTFARTLADDLRLARPGSTDTDLAAALDQVGVLAWTHALPDGLGRQTELANGNGPYARLWTAWPRAHGTVT